MQTYIFFLNRQRLFYFFLIFFIENVFCCGFYIEKEAGVISIRSPYAILWYSPLLAPVSTEAGSRNLV